jgi:hypothetical protein
VPGGTAWLELGEEYVKVTASEGPLEWPCSPLIARLEGQQAPFKVGPGGRVAQCEEFALDDGKVDFDLVEPTGVDRRMDQNDMGPLGAEPVGRWLTAMGGTIVSDQEHATRRTIRCASMTHRDHAVGNTNAGGTPKPALKRRIGFHDLLPHALASRPDK